MKDIVKHAISVSAEEAFMKHVRNWHQELLPGQFQGLDDKDVQKPPEVALVPSFSALSYGQASIKLKKVRDPFRDVQILMRKQNRNQ